MSSIYVDLEADVDSDGTESGREDSGEDDFIDDTPVIDSRVSSIHSTKASTTSTIPSTDLVDSLLQRYTKPSIVHHDPSIGLDIDLANRIEDVQLAPRQAGDWDLWMVRCKPGHEFEIVNALALRTDISSNPTPELRSAFSNPNHVGLVYLEARFSYRTGHGDSYTYQLFHPSLFHILSQRSDVFMRTLKIVRFSEDGPMQSSWTRSLRIIDSDRTFKSGDWVEVRRGLYRGDFGLVQQAPEGDTNGAIEVLVVPRLSISSPKRKSHTTRPPLMLFHQEHCRTDQHHLVRKLGNNVFDVAGVGTMDHGLFHKFLSPHSLSHVYAIPHTYQKLFDTSGHPALKAHAFPEVNKWEFLVDEEVRILGPPQRRNPSRFALGKFLGHVEIPQQGRLCQVLITFEGVTDSHLHGGVSISQVEEIDAKYLRKVVEPGDSVKVAQGPEAGKVGLCTSRQMDTITVVEIRDDFRAQNSNVFRVHVNAAYLLKQSIYEDDSPWKGVQVIVQNGKYHKRSGIVQRAWPQNGSIRYLVRMQLEDRYEEFDYHNLRLFPPVPERFLLDSYPLSLSQQERFRIDCYASAMYTGSIPWLGLWVNIIRGQYKGIQGVVKGVDRYKVERNSTQSGVSVMVEVAIMSDQTSLPVVKFDYDDLRVVRSKMMLFLEDAMELNERQEFYSPVPTYVPTPVHNHHQRSLTPEPHSTYVPELGHAISRPMYLPLGLELRRNTNTPSPRAVPVSAERYWFIHPKLRNIPIRVEIVEGKYVSERNKRITPRYIRTIELENGHITTMIRASPETGIDIDTIKKFRERPKPQTEKKRMVVIGGREEDIGKVVRPIYYYYEGQKEDKQFGFVLAEMRLQSTQKNVVSNTGAVKTNITDISETWTGRILFASPDNVELTEVNGKKLGIEDALREVRESWRGYGVRSLQESQSSRYEFIMDM